MNKHFFYLILLFCISSCQPITKKMMNIEGVVSSEYNGQIIYLVPRPHPTPETVDSAYIVNGTFSFSIPADSAIYDIVISRRANAPIQRLLIVAEEGTLHANMGMNSSGTGTPLNNQLQHWKEQMESAGEKAALLSQKINKNKKDSTFTGRFNKNKKDSTITAILKKQRDSIYESFGDSTFCFIKQNLNPLGGYLFMTLEHMFNEQQANDLKRLGIEKWKPEP